MSRSSSIPGAAPNPLRHHSSVNERSRTFDRSREATSNERVRRRRSMNSISELDGVGLHERPDWPLPSPDRNKRNQAAEEGPAKVHNEPADESAVLRSPQDLQFPSEVFMNLDHHDVSEEEDEIEEEADGTSPGHEDKPSPVAHVNGGISKSRLDSNTPTRATRAGRDTDVTRDGTTYERDVSPTDNRSDAVRDSPQSPAREVNTLARDRDLLAVEPKILVKDRPAHFSIPRIREPVSDSESSRERLPSSVRDESEDYADELRDVPTEIASSTTPNFGRVQDYREGQANPDDDDNLGARSFVTPTLEPNAERRPSASSQTSVAQRRSSTYSLLSVQANATGSSPKDQVRYSWQSVHDSEPSRPRIHVIKLFSNTVTASAGFPQGEAFGFSISPSGRRIAAYNSARLYVLQTAALPVGISQDFALKRRPLAVEITDDASTIAILADDHTVSIYTTSAQGTTRTRTIALDFPSNCIALAPGGGLLAVAYEGGIEIFSLDPSALPTDRRAVRSSRMDRMAFSEDGASLLGSTTRINVSSTVIVNVPIFPAAPDGVPTHDELKEAWCSELLHPENIKNSSHATYMRENGTTCNERLFAWNGVVDTFGILNVNNLEYGNVDFPIVITPPLSTCGGLGAAMNSCPAVDEDGDTVAMIVNDRTVRLYIVPPKGLSTMANIEAHSIDHELDAGYGCPFGDVKWVYNSISPEGTLQSQTRIKGRLLVTSPGGVAQNGVSAEETFEDIEGGRIILFDFDPHFAGQPGKTFSLSLGKGTPQLLDEEPVSVADQVALVRRRTVNQSKKGNLSSKSTTLGRAATTLGSRRLSRQDGFGEAGDRQSVIQRMSMLSVGSVQPDRRLSLIDVMEEGVEQPLAVDEPYAQGAPRSHASLQRAATNAQRHRFQALEERQQEHINADSTGGFLALPEYSEEPNAPLPSRFRAMAGLDPPAMFDPNAAANARVAGGDASPAAQLSHTSSAVDMNASFAEDAEATFADMVRTMPSSVAVNGDVPPSATSQSFDPRSLSDEMQRSNSRQHQTVVPPGGQESVTSNLPRSLARAYANAPVVDPMHASNTNLTDWDAVSPIQARSTSRSQYRNPAADDRRRDVISPIQSSPLSSPVGTGPSIAFWPNSDNTANGSETYDRDDDNNTNHFNASLAQSMFTDPRQSSSQIRAPSSNGSYTTSNSIAAAARNEEDPAAGKEGASVRRLPPHMQSFRRAAAAAAAIQDANDANASLARSSPSTRAPLQQAPRTAPASSATHPITAWHPPAASAPSETPANSQRTKSRRGAPAVLTSQDNVKYHRRHSSSGAGEVDALNASSAASLAPRSKRGAIFRRNKTTPDLKSLTSTSTSRLPDSSGGPERGSRRGGRRPTDADNDNSMMETRSTVTYLTKRDKAGEKCAIM
jgi:hypothetical protein